MTQSPYRENVRDLINRPGEMRERERSIRVPERFGESLVSVPEGETMDLSVRLESVHEGILATVDVRTTVHAECGRCLEPFTEPLELEFQELFPYSVQEGDEYGVHGDHVDLEPPLRDAVVLSLPFQPVCSPDCPGLDPVTGQKRTETSDTIPHDEIDARWAALAELITEEEPRKETRE